MTHTSQAHIKRVHFVWQMADVNNLDGLAAEVQRLQALLLGTRGARSIAGQEWRHEGIPFN